MGKQTKSRKVVGKGKVTPVQVAFIVDRYLSDNNFVRTRSTFRTEASHLISKSPVNEAPKSLLSLADMLDEYICLKEQKVLLNQEKLRLDQEKSRVQTLLRGMQDAMNAYTLPTPMLRPPLLSPVNNTPVMMSTNFSTPTPTATPTPTTMAIASTSTSQSQATLKKRKNSKDVVSAAVPSASKRTRTQPLVRSSASAKPPTITSNNNNNNNNNNQQITPVPSNTNLSPVQGSSVAKCLFNPGPQTPSPSPPLGDNQTPPSSNKKTVTPQQFTSTNRTVITSETIQVSPMKQVSYYSIERNQCITSPMKTTSKRFSTVKGRLDFDGSEMLTSDENNTESPSEDDAFDFDLPNLDCLGADFNLTDLLGDFDFDVDGEQMDYLCQPDNGSSPESLSPDTTVDDSACDHELLTGMSSTVTEILSEQDMNVAGAAPNSVTSVKSITKSIKVFSPVKSRNP